jgi:beta-1,4-mannooligosaccharide/beta-1,4-mannosyl-N-acetylglucosamine phosphorylase
MRPELDFEQEGFVANVVFPTGVVASGDSLLIYYGASDKYTAVVEMSLPEIMQALH